jgi:hypothetical protein
VFVRFWSSLPTFFVTISVVSNSKHCYL